MENLKKVPARIAVIYIILTAAICQSYVYGADNQSEKIHEGELNSPDVKKGGKKRLGAYKVFRSAPTKEEVTEDSKPANLSLIDALLFRKATISIGYGKIKLLVAMLGSKVEYVWSPPYDRYVRPKFVLQNAQDLYDKRR